MAAASVEEMTSHDESGLELKKTQGESVTNLIKELRATSTKSLSELDQVNQFLGKLEKDEDMWSRETDDPIMKFDLENLKQAFRETILLSGRYKAACKNLEHHLLKLEEHSGLITGCTIQAVNSEPEFSCVARCIAHCCAHVDEYGSKYDDLKRHLCDIIDKYCMPHTATIGEQCGIQYVLDFLQSLSSLNDQYSQDLPLHAQLDELMKAKQMAVVVVEGSQVAKKRWMELNANWTALKSTKNANE